MVSISGALGRIKREVLEPLSRTAIEEVCRNIEGGHRYFCQKGDTATSA